MYTASDAGRADRQADQPHQAVLHVRIRPRDVQLDGLDRRVQRHLRQVSEPDGRRDLGMGGPGHLEPTATPSASILAYGGGFGEVPNDHYFIHKGVVFSDRSPKPHYPEMKRAYQWIGIAAEDLAAGKVRIRNKYAVHQPRPVPRRVDPERGRRRRSEQGELRDAGPCPGRRTEVIAVAVQAVHARNRGAEYFLRVSFTLAKDELWAKAGYEVAAAQFKLPVQVPAVAAVPATNEAARSSTDDAAKSSSPATASRWCSTRPKARFPNYARRRQPADGRRRAEAAPLACAAPQRRHVGLPRLAQQRPGAT